MLRETIRFVGRRWRLILLASFLCALGCVLHQILPVEPRWRTALDGALGQGDFYWDAEHPVVRCLRGAGLARLSDLDNDETFDFLEYQVGPILEFDLHNGRVVASYSSKTEALWDVQVTPDGRFAVAGIYPKGAIRWIDFWGKKELLLPLPTEFKNPVEVRFSPHGSYFLVLGRTEKLIHNESDGLNQVLVCETASGKRVYYSAVPRPAPTFVDDQTILLARDGEKPDPLLWDLKTAREIVRLPEAGPPFFSDGKSGLLLTGGNDQWHFFWDISDRMRPRRVLSFQTDLLRLCFSSPDGRLFVRPAGDDDAQICEIRTGRKVQQLPFPIVWCSQFSPDCSRLLIDKHDASGSLSSYDLAKCEMRWEYSLRMTPPMGEGDHPRVWNLPVFSRDSKKLIVEGAGGTVDILDAESGAPLAKYPAACHWLERPALTAAGCRALIHGRNCEISNNAGPFQEWLWRFFPPRKRSDPLDLVCVLDLERDYEVFRLEDSAVAAALSPDGETLLVAGSDEANEWSLTCWDVPARRPWAWIIGPPAAFASLFIGLRWLHSRFQR